VPTQSDFRKRLEITGRVVQKDFNHPPLNLLHKNGSSELRKMSLVYKVMYTLYMAFMAETMHMPNLGLNSETLDPRPYISFQKDQ
jgi:hypothetical protein